jgi:uncharacterized membrane protein YciS (DUF1049 family)
MVSSTIRGIISILIIGAVLWFAVANASVVTINLIFWEVSASIALVVGIVFVLGFLLGVLRLAPGFLRNRSAARANERTLNEVQKERDSLKERSHTLEEQVRQLAPLETGAKD